MKSDSFVRSPALKAAIAAAGLDRLQDRRGFDAIVVGAGAAGGMAAMRLTQAGLQVLVLDAGWRAPFWQAPMRAMTWGAVGAAAHPRLKQWLPSRAVNLGRRALREAGRRRQPVQTKCYCWELAPSSFVDDCEHPYVAAPDSRFDWLRAHQLGGRMIIPGHGRQYFRLAERDMSPDDGLSPRWPLRLGELDSWYGLAERLLGLSGGDEVCPWVPAGPMTHRLTPTASEIDTMERITERWPAAQAIMGRWAPPLKSLDAAAATGLLFCRQGAIAREVEIDPTGHVRGVRWFDRAAGGLCSARAPIVFLCASTLESTRILLSSGSSATPDGIGARSGALGRYLMDHVVVSGEGGGGALPGEPVAYTSGRCIYLPRFDLRSGHAEGGRGYGIQIYRTSHGRGRSFFNASAFAEMTPRVENHVALDPEVRDAWGAPVLRISCRHNEAELALARDQAKALMDLGELMGVRYYNPDFSPGAPGSSIHECGTARMGESPEFSVLDPNNQCWDVRGLYVTDAAAFPSQGAQNPTLTILALTARACDHAVRTSGVAERLRRPDRASTASLELDRLRTATKPALRPDAL